MNINNYKTLKNQPKFMATKVAKASVFVNNNKQTIDILKLGKEDSCFVNAFVKWHNSSIQLVPRVKKVFNYCIAKFFESVNPTYVAINDSKLCGIKSVNNSKEISLDAIIDRPCNAIEFYKKHGFKALEGSIKEIFDNREKKHYLYMPMTCNKNKIKNQLQNFSSFINYETVKPEKINLFDYCTI